MSCLAFNDVVNTFHLSPYTKVVDLGLAPKFFEFLSLEHTNNNVHNVRLCLVLARSRAVPMAALCGFGAGHKAGTGERVHHARHAGAGAKTWRLFVFSFCHKRSDGMLLGNVCTR